MRDDGRFSILDEVERVQARRRLSRRRILASALGVGVLGVAAGTAFGVFSTDSEQADQPDAPSRVDPGLSTAPTPGVLAGPAKTPLWTKVWPVASDGTRVYTAYGATMRDFEV
jgi:hypothetical protein